MVHTVCKLLFFTEIHVVKGRFQQGSMICQSFKLSHKNRIAREQNQNPWRVFSTKLCHMVSLQTPHAVHGEKCVYTSHKHGGEMHCSEHYWGEVRMQGFL